MGNLNKSMKDKQNDTNFFSLPVIRRGKIRKDKKERSTEADKSEDDLNLEEKSEAHDSYRKRTFKRKRENRNQGGAARRHTASSTCHWWQKERKKTTDHNTKQKSSKAYKAEALNKKTMRKKTSPTKSEHTCSC